MNELVFYDQITLAVVELPSFCRLCILVKVMRLSVRCMIELTILDLLDLLVKPFFLLRC